jgi:signal transduction histidine kinase
MGSFWTGLVLGAVLGLIVAAGVAVVLYRRSLTLQKRAREAERLAELGTLTGGLAHEIKNPLSTVQLNLQLLMEDIEPDNPQRQRLVNRLGIVQRETSRLRDILDDFLRYAGRIELDPQPVELNGMLEELVDFFAPQAQAQRVQLRLKTSPAKLTVNVDPRLIKQAVLNLMLNGMQAMDGNSGGELILSCSSTATHALIDVIDTGKGIPPDVQRKIFRAYFSMRKGGTGLGLAMSKRIVDEHGGTLTLKSEVGKGSDFTISLPLKG